MLYAVYFTPGVVCPVWGATGRRKNERENPGAGGRGLPNGKVL